MSIRGITSEEQASAQARIVVSLTYVQTLRRELEAGRLSPAMFEDYLARLESHLIEVERNSALFAAKPTQHLIAEPTGVDEDMLVSEHISHG